MPDANATHYVARFTTHQRGREQAVCGRYIDKGEFSTEPTCPICREWLADDEAAFNSVKDLGPAEHPITSPHFDSLSGYRQRS